MIFYFYFGLWVFVWGIEDLDLYRYCVFVFVVVVSVILGARDSLQEREKKNVFNSRKDEQLLLELGELLFISFGISPEWRVWWQVFCEFFVIFLSFQPNREADNNALKNRRNYWVFGMKSSHFSLWMWALFMGPTQEVMLLRGWKNFNRRI